MERLSGEDRPDGGRAARGEVPPGYLAGEASLILLTVDLSGTVAGCNTFGRELLGFDPTGRPFRDVLADPGKEVRPADLPAPGSGEPALLNLVTFTGLAESLRCRALPSGAGHLVLGSLGARETELLRYEVLELNREHAHLNRSLQKANGDLARLGELKSQFLGMAAHDLRRSAGAVLSYAELLLDGGAVAGERDRGYLERIVGATRFMAAVIDNFLATALADAGALTITREAVAPRDVVDEVFLLSAPAARRKDVVLAAHLPPDVPVARADRSKLSQALLNLVANAVEHSPRGGRVGVEARAGEGRLVFEVRDQGPGVAPEEVTSLFETYARGSARKTAGERSTGLGLAIARLVAEAHGGRVRVGGGPGGCFFLEVPLEPPPVPSKGESSDAA